MEHRENKYFLIVYYVLGSMLGIPHIISFNISSTFNFDYFKINIKKTTW